MITLKRKMKQVLQNGILIRVCKNNMTQFQFLIPPDCIFLTKETINDEKLILPVIYLTQDYEPLKERPDDKN